MTTGSATDLLVLHAVRLSGMADDHQVAGRYGLDQAIARRSSGSDVSKPIRTS